MRMGHQSGAFALLWMSLTHVRQEKCRAGAADGPVLTLGFELHAETAACQDSDCANSRLQYSKEIGIVAGILFPEPQSQHRGGFLPFLLYLRKQSRSNHTCYLRELCHGRGIFKVIFPFLQSMWLFCVLLGCLCYPHES